MINLLNCPGGRLYIFFFVQNIHFQVTVGNVTKNKIDENMWSLKKTMFVWLTTDFHIRKESEAKFI